MLAQLKEIQSHSEKNVSQSGRLEAQLIESERRREELRSKAQEAVRQWKTKCKKLEREFQELKDKSRNDTDKDTWVRLNNMWVVSKISLFCILSMVQKNKK